MSWERSHKFLSIDTERIEKEKIEKFTALQKILTDLVKILEKKVLEQEKNDHSYLNFIQDVCKFASWIETKFDYRYFGNNKRVVKRGEIYYCALGENIGSEQSEHRPVIILQNDSGNKFGPTTIIAPITNTHKKLPVHVPLNTGMKTTGVIRLEHIREVAKCRLGIFIEKVQNDSPLMKQINTAIKISLDL
jgi:mRNA interferase MazF